jgi:heme oxygenase (biliverdin-producing, ferredoxin)
MTPPSDVLAGLRAATARAHADAERHAFVRELFGPSPRRDVHVRYLSGLLPVYGALEDALHARPDDAGFLADPRLARRAAIAADLTVLAAGPVDAPPASHVYSARIRDVAGDLPRLAAHAYVRYLGDLAGGQQMGERVEAAFGASRTFRFDAFPSTREASLRIREELARIGASPGAKAAMEEEAVRGFTLTIALFSELVSP